MFEDAMFVVLYLRPDDEWARGFADWCVYSFADYGPVMHQNNLEQAIIEYY